jgi:hypothetical protein
MNNDLESDHGMSAQLSSEYGAIATESAPEKLDRAILRLAKQEVRSSSGAAWRDRWYRPAVFVATVSLSLALVLQLNESSFLVSPDGVTSAPLNGITPVPESAFQDAARATSQQLRQIEADAKPSMSDSTSPMSVPERSAGTTDSGTLLPTNGHCSTEQRANIESWWRCIKELESKGLTQFAELELQALLRDYPQFVAPE